MRSVAGATRSLRRLAVAGEQMDPATANWPVLGPHPAAPKESRAGDAGPAQRRAPAYPAWRRPIGQGRGERRQQGGAAPQTYIGRAQRPDARRHHYASCPNTSESSAPPRAQAWGAVQRLASGCGTAEPGKDSTASPQPPALVTPLAPSEQRCMHADTHADKLGEPLLWPPRQGDQELRQNWPT
jgi:hypothetical protein